MPAFGGQVYDARLESVGATRALWLTASDQACGRPAALTFAETAFCDRPIVWNEPLCQLDCAPLATVRMIG